MPAHSRWRPAASRAAAICDSKRRAGGGVRHRARDIDQVPGQPERPVLEPPGRGIGRVGGDRGTDERARPGRLDGGAQRGHERREMPGPERTPSIGEGPRVQERFGLGPRLVAAPFGLREIRRHRPAERLQRLAAVVEFVGRIAQVVEMHAVQRIALHDVADDRRGVVDGAGETGDRYRPSSASGSGLRRLVARVANQPAQIFRSRRVERREVLAERTRHHQPLGVAIDDVIAGGGQVGAGHEIDVDPRVDRHPRAVRGRDRPGERIEGGL